jgi:hypothetical protein
MAAFELDDALAMEGEATSAEVYYKATQRAINAGLWSLPGRNGRAMMEAIEAGRCLLGPNRATDYYGNNIPSRSDVKDGTKGSRGFVVEAYGEDWAKLMEAT